MEAKLFERLQRLSIELTNNNLLLPVAAVIGDGATVTAPSVSKALQGRLPVNRILETLRRLARLGVLDELPYPGKPHARVFARVDDPFWPFVAAWVADASVDCVGRR